MENNKNKKFINNLIYFIISFQAFLTAIFFIIQTCRIYFGEHKYSRSIVIDSIIEILVVIIIFVVLIIGGGIYFHINKIKNKTFTKVSFEYRNNNILKRLDLSNLENDEDYKEYLKLNKKSKFAWLINGVILLICAFMCCCYLFNVNHFISTGDAVKQVKKMAYFLSPFVIIGLISSIICVYYVENNNKKINVILQLLLKNNKKENINYYDNNKEKLVINILRGVIFIIAIGCIIHGVIVGGDNSVLGKASAICTECIGLG